MAALVCPIAFVSEHSETLVELDVEYRELAHKLGVPGYFRAPTQNSDAAFIAALAAAGATGAEQRAGALLLRRRAAMPAGAWRLPARQYGCRGGAAEAARSGVTTGTRRPPRPAAVLFDCDGVLADSEGLVNRLVAEELTARGWPISADACRETFLGMALPDMLPVIEARVGRLPRRWAAALSERIAVAMLRELEPMPGALQAVRAVAEAGVPAAVASNCGAGGAGRPSSNGSGWPALFAGRVFSFEDVARPKPAPDIYLAAARACGAASPGDCVVVEDSLLGVRAGLAAGCRVLGLVGESDASVLAAAGAEPFGSMAALPGLLGLLAVTLDALAPFYSWTKALHLLSVFAWVAGLFYLPRLYVYHSAAAPGSESSETFKTMERRLLRAIMNPAMIAAWFFGLLLVLTPGVVDWRAGWWHGKARGLPRHDRLPPSPGDGPEGVRRRCAPTHARGTGASPTRRRRSSWR